MAQAASMSQLPRPEAVGAGYVYRYFEGFSQGLWMKRYRCPDCRAVYTCRLREFYKGFHYSILSILVLLLNRIIHGRWLKCLSRQLQQYWYRGFCFQASRFRNIKVPDILSLLWLLRGGRIPATHGIDKYRKFVFVFAPNPSPFANGKVKYPKMAEAHVLLADLSYFWDWDWPAAEKAFRRAIELNPGNVLSQMWFSSFLIAMGREEESLAESKITLQLDPLSPRANYFSGLCFYFVRMYDSCIKQLKYTLELNPNSWLAYRLLALAYIEKGMNEEALIHVRKAFDINNSPTNLSIIGYVNARTGNRYEAERILKELKERSKSGYIRPGAFSIIYASLGEKDRVFKLLDECYEERDSALFFLKTSWFDNIRSDSRYVALLKKMNFDY